MAPFPARQLLVWSLPSIAVLLSYLWYKKRRIGVRSDGGGIESFEDIIEISEKEEEPFEFELNDDTLESVKTESEPSTPTKQFNRSLSGVETTPINIVYPPELRSSKSSPVVISDEDLDKEIEKVKSMKNGYSSPSTISNISISISIAKRASSSSSSSPIKELTDDTPKKTNKSKKDKSAKKMAQKDIAVVEEKLTSLKIGKSKESSKEKKGEKEHNERTGDNEMHEQQENLQRQNSERDSANHSPADVMLASPSLSSISDHHSEGSSDSGKGGSDVATPPPSRTPNSSVSIGTNVPIIYEFLIPQTLVGKLIGRKGCFVQHIKEKSNAHILVRKHPTNNKLKVCSLEGTQGEIDKALKMIREKFPLKRYSEVTLEQVSFTPLVSTVPLIPDHLYLKLVEGVNNDTILSCMVAPNHLFMQQPTHPSFPSLNLLNTYMNSCYSEANSPLLPSPIPENTVCAAFSIDSWYRAMVLSSDPESDTSYVKFLDYGGYAYVENDKLRQIRQDFILLPFQAAECMLSNVKSINEDGSWSKEAYNLVADITKGSIIYTQVADYTEEGIPLVLCYVVTGPRDVVFLNQRLVDEGFAEWVPFEETAVETLVGAEAVEACYLTDEKEI